MIKLTPAQENASAEFTQFMLNTDERHMIIGGWAGCGKTTLVKHLLKKVEDEEKMYKLLLGQSRDELQVRLTATTNKAAGVLEDSCGVETDTIHSLLGLKVQNDYRSGKTKIVKTKDYEQQEHTLLFIDEASFIDECLLNHIISATTTCKVVFIMDPFQLAPVHEKKPPVWELPVRKVMLEDVVRQGVGNNNNPIATLSAAFREAVKTGVFPQIIPDGNYIHVVNGPQFQSAVDNHFKQHHQDPSQGKILAWTNQRVQQYNQHVRSVLGYSNHFEVGEFAVTNNPIFDHKTRGIVMRTDQIAQITNLCDEAEKEGVSGRFIELNHGHQWFMPYNHNDLVALNKRLVANKDWPKYFMIKEFWLDLRPLHSCTCHKSQGSTYSKVFIDLGDIGRCSDISDVARMLYVATSRASKEVYFYGSLPRRFGG